MIAGLKLEEFFENGTACWDRYMNFTCIEMLDFQTNMTDDNVKYQVLNVSHVITNVSEHALVCTNFVRSIYDYTIKKLGEFGGFSGFTTAFFQNLLANVISINNIYAAVEEHQATGNETGVLYEVGRLVRILIIDIDPIEVFSLEDAETEFVRYNQLSFFNDGNSPVAHGKNSFLEDDWLFRILSSHIKGEATYIEDLEALDNVFGKAFSFTLGFFNGTTIISGENLTVCEERIVTMVEKIVSTYELIAAFTADTNNITNLLDGVDSALYTTY